MTTATKGPDVPSPPRTPVAQPPWQRLHPRMVVVSVSWLAGPAAALLGTMFLARDLLNTHGWIVLGSYIVVAAVQAGHEWVRYRTTRFRITDGEVELHSGLLFRTDKSIPRDRVRSADLTANPVHRLFGLAAVKVGTGQHTGKSEDDELVLDGISRAQAVQFRALLLNRGGPDGGTDAAPALPVPLARLSWSWARYAPLTVTSLAGVLAVVTGGSKLLDTLGLDLTDSRVARDTWDRLDALPVAVAVAAVAAVLLVIGVAGSLVSFAEAWYGHRIEREPEGSLHLMRGLLTSRSVSVAERRVCGVELSQPLPLRAVAAARLTLLATGLGGPAHRFSNPAQLLPPAPLDSAHRVTADVLNEAASPIAEAELRGHPRPALRRRLVRGCLLAPAAAAAAAGAGTAAGLLPWWSGAAAALLTAAFGYPLARDAYRGLGHALSGDYIVVRHGTFVRRTVALRRDRIVGFTGRQSYGQRRAGLFTLTATTAAGKGAVRIRDVDVCDGLCFAEAALPGLVAPFGAPEPSPAG
ncbi:Bacterial membrane flanked domain protein [Streptomyces sp. YIM 121038]|uniref:PH domain-containing protein n=1 Tax=Streptomyces sp. YIM 121038 TaxID=2136401 RepID=UPI0011103747|nr:PH domain-containing protein [Streptomyces sp. YIM 121038]QCX80428.1 Bacterial membrane flanked domain protein [Streptomyces sp. YIM 121038]